MYVCNLCNLYMYVCIWKPPYCTIHLRACSAQNADKADKAPRHVQVAQNYLIPRPILIEQLLRPYKHRVPEHVHVHVVERLGIPQQINDGWLTLV